RQWLGRAAAGKNDDGPGIKTANVLRPDHDAVGNAQKFEGVGNLDVVDHAAADEGDFAVDARGNVDDLLNAMNGGSEAGKNHAPRRRAAQFLNSRNDGALGWRESRPLHVGRVAEERQHAFASVFRESTTIPAHA